MITGKALCLLALVVVATAQQERIINADIEAYPYQFPHRISIRVNVNNLVGSGAILSNIWVLTTSRTVNQWAKHPQKLTAWAGGRSSLDGTRSNVTRVVVHPKFVRKTLLNDIALLKVTPILFIKDRVAPIKLPTAALEDGVRIWADVNGWGAVTNNLGKRIQGVAYLSVRTIPARECVDRLVVFNPINRLCAQVAGQQTFGPNSSGNVLALNGEPNVIVGLLTIWFDKPLVPDVFTRVWPYVPFIRRVMSS